jgi:hypothetical protein
MSEAHSGPLGCRRGWLRGSLSAWALASLTAACAISPEPRTAVVAKLASYHEHLTIGFTGSIAELVEPLQATFARHSAKLVRADAESARISLKVPGATGTIVVRRAVAETRIKAHGSGDDVGELAVQIRACRHAIVAAAKAPPPPVEPPSEPELAPSEAAPTPAPSEAAPAPAPSAPAPSHKGKSK